MRRSSRWRANWSSRYGTISRSRSFWGALPECWQIVNALLTRSRSGWRADATAGNLLPAPGLRAQREGAQRHRPAARRKGGLTRVGRALKQLGIPTFRSIRPSRAVNRARVCILYMRCRRNRGWPRSRRSRAANCYVKEHFVPNYNARFPVPATKAGPGVHCLRRPAVPRSALHPRGAQHRPRQLRALEGQIAAAAPTLLQATVRVHDYPDGGHVIVGRPGATTGPTCFSQPDRPLRDRVAIQLKNCVALADLPGQWIDAVHQRSFPVI
jgi:hypothetical protein